MNVIAIVWACGLPCRSFLSRFFSSTASTARRNLDVFLRFFPAPCRRVSLKCSRARKKTGNNRKWSDGPCSERTRSALHLAGMIPRRVDCCRDSTKTRDSMFADVNTDDVPVPSLNVGTFHVVDRISLLHPQPPLNFRTPCTTTPAGKAEIVRIGNNLLSLLLLAK